MTTQEMSNETQVVHTKVAQAHLEKWDIDLKKSLKVTH